MTEPFGEYDRNKLKKARQLVYEVYGYNFGAPYMGKYTQRLKTVMKKLDELIQTSSPSNPNTP